MSSSAMVATAERCAYSSMPTMFLTDHSFRMSIDDHCPTLKIALGRGITQVTTSQVDTNGCPSGNVDPGTNAISGANYMVNYPTLGYCNANATYPGLPYCPTSQPSWSAYRCATIRPCIPARKACSTRDCIICFLTVPALTMIRQRFKYP